MKNQKQHLSGWRMIQRWTLAILFSLGVGAVIFTGYFIENKMAWAQDATVTVTAATQGPLTPGPDELSGQHPALTQKFTATQNAVDPNQECIQSQATWQWAVDKVAFALSTGDNSTKAPTQAQLDAKKAAMTVTASSTDPSQATLNIPEKLLDKPGTWTVTVKATWSCPLKTGGTLSNSGTASVEIKVWGVEFAIGGQSSETIATDDDYVMLKDGVGEYRQRGTAGTAPATTGPNAGKDKADKHRQVFPFQVKAWSRVLGNPTSLSSKITVTLSNPDGRLGFPKGKELDLTTGSVDVATSGAWKSFDINGQDKSAGIGDAMIVGKWKNADGVDQEVGRKGSTVFWFEGTITVTVGGKYGIQNANAKKFPWRTNDDVTKIKISSFTVPSPNHAVTVTSTTKLKPDGANTKAPQISSWVIGHVQNVLTLAHSSTGTFSPPWFDWGGLAKKGTVATIPRSLEITGAIPKDQLPILDNRPKIGTPLWDGKSDPVQTSVTHTNTDTPGENQGPRYGPHTAANNKQGTLYRFGYVITAASIADTFSVWSVVKNDTCTVPIAQSNWSLSVRTPNNGSAASDGPPPQLGAPVTDTDKVGLEYLNPGHENPSNKDPVKVTYPKKP